MACYGGCALEHPRVRGRIWLGGPHIVPVPVHPAVQTPLPPGSASWGPVRGCPWNWRHRSTRARTYNRQRHCRQPREISFPQVIRHVEVQAEAYYKTVGFAYPGSNPGPATTCENAPLAANFSCWRGVFRCPGVCHHVALWTPVLRCPRTYSGRASVLLGRSVRTVRTVVAHRRRFHGRPRMGRIGGAISA
jgi:hypothetical protein